MNWVRQWSVNKLDSEVNIYKMKVKNQQKIKVGIFIKNQVCKTNILSSIIKYI